MSSLVFSVYFDITFTLLSKVSINILILPIVLSYRKIPSLKRFHVFGFKIMRECWQAPAKLRLLPMAARSANAADKAARRGTTDTDIAIPIGTDTQATPTTAQLGRVLGTITFSKGIL